jgi:hypothetical protein
VPGFAEATKCIALVCADTLAFLFSSGQAFPISDKKGVVLATLLLVCNFDQTCARAFRQNVGSLSNRRTLCAKFAQPDGPQFEDHLGASKML